jgi:hypothetical protein
MFLYVGDVWIDEVTSLQYQTTQVKTPIYGYASQLWDDCSAGHVIVQGGFTINFKEQGYLWAALRRYKEISETDAGLLAGEEDSRRLRAGQRKAARRDRQLFSKSGREASQNKPVVGSNGTRIQRSSIERLAQGEATRGERYEFYQNMAGYSSFDVASPKDRIFEDIVEAFEDQIWTVHDNSVLNSQIRRTDDNKFDNFDMYVVFGNYANPRANHTVQKIIDVRLTSQGKAVMINGQPVQESYSFIGQTTA